MKDFALSSYQDARETIRALDAKANILLVVTSLLFVFWLDDGIAIQSKLAEITFLYWGPLVLLQVELLVLLFVIYPRFGAQEGTPLWQVGSVPKKELETSLLSENWIKFYRVEMVKLEGVIGKKIRSLEWAVILLGFGVIFMLLGLAIGNEYFS